MLYNPSPVPNRHTYTDFCSFLCACEKERDNHFIIKWKWLIGGPARSATSENCEIFLTISMRIAISMQHYIINSACLHRCLRFSYDAIITADPAHGIH